MATIYEGTVLTGIKNSSYTVGAFISKGGEGDVYEIVGHPDQVIKIYNDKKMAPTNFVPDMRKFLEEKLTTMVNYPVERNNKRGKLCIAWPMDALYESGKFVGYAMPRVNTKRKIYDVCRESSRLSIFPEYTWRYSVAIALNLAWTVNNVHQKGYCIGDFNPNNILIDEHANITIIDTDSFDITDPRTGKVYKCMVGVPEMLAPELQGRGDLRSPRARFTKEADNFSLAIHIFNLLMNNCHPFNCTNINTGRSSSNNAAIETDIAEGHYYYGKLLPSDIKLPISAPNYYMLPDYIRRLFDRTFQYSPSTLKEAQKNRTTAEEWYEGLKRLYNEAYVGCPQNKHHVYVKSTISSCPWCMVQKQIDDANKNNHQYIPVNGQNNQKGFSYQGGLNTQQNAYQQNNQNSSTNQVIPKKTNWKWAIFALAVALISVILILRNNGTNIEGPQSSNDQTYTDEEWDRIHLDIPNYTSGENLAVGYKNVGEYYTDVLNSDNQQIVYRYKEAMENRYYEEGLEDLDSIVLATDSGGVEGYIFINGFISGDDWVNVSIDATIYNPTYDQMDYIMTIFSGAAQTFFGIDRSKFMNDLRQGLSGLDIEMENNASIDLSKNDHSIYLFQSVGDGEVILTLSII